MLCFYIELDLLMLYIYFQTRELGRSCEAGGVPPSGLLFLTSTVSPPPPLAAYSTHPATSIPPASLSRRFSRGPLIQRKRAKRRERCVRSGISGRAAALSSSQASAKWRELCAMLCDPFLIPSWLLFQTQYTVSSSGVKARFSNKKKIVPISLYEMWCELKAENIFIVSGCGAKYSYQNQFEINKWIRN
jgi:hypothetical protein